VLFIASYPITSRYRKQNSFSRRNVIIQSLFEKEGLGEILLDKSPSTPSLYSPPFSKGEVNVYEEIGLERGRE